MFKHLPAVLSRWLPLVKVVFVLFLLAATPALPASAAGNCSRLDHNLLVSELEVRDFLNRLPPQYKRDATTLASTVTTFDRIEHIDWDRLSQTLEHLRSRLTEVPNHYALPSDFKKQASALLEEAIAASKTQDRTDVESILQRANSYLDNLTNRLQSSSLEGSSELASALQNAQNFINEAIASATTEEVRETKVPINSFEEEFRSINLDTEDLRGLMRRAASGSRPLGDCTEDELFATLYKDQATIMRVHDGDDRRLVPDADALATVALPLSQESGSQVLAETQAAAVGLLVLSSRVNNSGQTTIETHPYREVRNLCTGEPFENAVTSPDPVCTAFIVNSGNDKHGAFIATARHCLEKLHPAQTSFVLNYRGSPNGPFPKLQAIHIKDPVRDQGTSPDDDWALLELAQPLKDIKALSLRSQGEVLQNEPLFILGYPDGLPLIVASNAIVQGFGDVFERPFLFEANVDTLGGNSGSPVFNLHSGVVEGVLSRGDRGRPFESSKGCSHILPCKSLTDCRWEKVTRISRLVAAKDRLLRVFQEGAP